VLLALESENNFEKNTGIPRVSTEDLEGSLTCLSFDKGLQYITADSASVMRSWKTGFKHPVTEDPDIEGH
jgi:hypothetical protein